MRGPRMGSPTALSKSRARSAAPSASAAAIGKWTCDAARVAGRAHSNASACSLNPWSPTRGLERTSSPGRETTRIARGSRGASAACVLQSPCTFISVASGVGSRWRASAARARRRSARPRRLAAPARHPSPPCLYRRALALTWSLRSVAPAARGGSTPAAAAFREQTNALTARARATRCVGRRRRSRRSRCARRALIVSAS